LFNRKGWEHILNAHGGKLPIRIKAVPEGTVVPVDNVLMTVENLGGKETKWLTNALESILLHVWYPTTVATISYDLKKFFLECKAICSDDSFVDFMLHDFGYRGVSSSESAGAGGAAHLVSFKGTDTLPAMRFAIRNYKANLNDLAFSVPATEHSVMTSHGEDGELQLISDLIDRYPTGILSVVCDSYSSTRFVREYCRTLKDKILNRQPNGIGVCKFVVRPDSLRHNYDSPAEQMVDFTRELEDIFGTTINFKGYKVLHPKVGLLWGDGIDPKGIRSICTAVMDAGYSVDHLVFGMGGGLLQKVNRDTERFAFKCSAQERNGSWHKIQKRPLDVSKISKGGRMKLVKEQRYNPDTDTSTYEYKTITESHPLYHDMGPDILETVFLNGEITKQYTFDEVRQNATCKS
jgi:nicotinamide phosphoribosyltransferase